MTPGEIRGLQHLAKAAGGTLSVNPSTGLPEAGFLEDMLPMIIGGGLMAMTGGAAAPALAGMTPGMIGLGIGGVQALRTGNLMDGVKAGLGAYGGAGLAGGLIGLGTQELGTQAALSGGNAAQAVTTAQASPFATAGKGLETMFGGGNTAAGASGLSAGVDAMGGISGIAKSGLAGLAPMMMSDPATPTPITPDANMGQRYSYDKGPTTPFPQPDVPRAGSPEQNESFGKERRYFDPRYTKIGADDAKKLYGFAEGGETSIRYDPGKQQYEIIKQNQSRSPTNQEMVDAAGKNGNVDSGGGGGGDGSTGGSSNSSSGYGDFGMGAIGAGQALSGYGSMFGGLAPGGMLASLAGAGLLAHGIGQLGEAEGAAATMGGVADSSGSYGGSAAGDAAMGGWGGGEGGAEGGGDAGGGGGDGGGGGGGGGGDGGGGEARGGLMHAYAAGGGYNLGDYSDGGRLLRGPGDGVSDSIPAMIGKKQPARLADGEFVVPARIVSELGNGSTEAGARKLYAMMDRIQSARGKTVGKGKVAKNSRAERYLPA
jgi:hypothetical protein